VLGADEKDFGSFSDAPPKFTIPRRVSEGRATPTPRDKEPQSRSTKRKDCSS
jgi:hypothetical protein